MNAGAPSDAALAARLALEPRPEQNGAAYRAQLVVAHLLVDGARVGTLLPGLVIERAFETDQGALLFLSDDCPSEELLTLSLLDARWRELERVSLGAMYASGRLHDLERLDRNRFRFRFFGEGDGWMLEVHPPRWRLHPLACVLRQFAGPITRRPRELFSRSRLRLEGHFSDGRGRSVRVRT